MINIKRLLFKHCVVALGILIPLVIANASESVSDVVAAPESSLVERQTANDLEKVNAELELLLVPKCPITLDDAANDNCVEPQGCECR